MNEQIRIELTANGQPMPVDRLDADGVVVRGESGAAPRRMLLEFDGVTEATRMRMRFVQQRSGWHPWLFPLNARVADGALVFSGLEPDTLPAGSYRCRLRIDDVILTAGGQFRVEVERDRMKTIVLAAREDPRQVRLTQRLDGLDERMRRVLQAAQSSVDGLSVPVWLETVGPRAVRKACLINILAKLRAMQDPLLDSVVSIFFAGVDRVYTRVTQQCGELLSRLADDAKKPFYREGPPKSPVHERILTRAGVTAADYTLDSFRQEGRNCLQVVVATPRDPERMHFAEFDIDLGNPLQDVTGFVVHIGEVAGPARTDHFALRGKLLKSSAGPFLCYDIVEPHVEAHVVG
jgi:hypothetical protein